MNFLKSLWNGSSGHKFNTGTMLVILPLVLQHCGLSPDDSTQAIAAGTQIVGGVVAVIGFVHKIIKANQKPTETTPESK